MNAKNKAVPKLAHTRPEKNAACEQACYAMRQTMAAHARENALNHVEALSSIAQVFASVLAGAYSDTKDREIVISALPDIVRAYLPQWDDIYQKYLATPEGKAAAAAPEAVS